MNWGFIIFISNIVTVEQQQSISSTDTYWKFPWKFHQSFMVGFVILFAGLAIEIFTNGTGIKPIPMPPGEIGHKYRGRSRP